ncbi:uncharacterized protein [Lepidochelys kempii]
MAVCEIKVHPTDATRMELVIPGEQYFYLKAGGAAERQKWLVALGSSKACLGDSRSQKDKDVHLSSESLGRKLSELRLYCDVLTQQVLDVQESTRPQDNGTPLDIEKMNEAASLLKATCSQFISTLEECMKFANARLAPELYQPSPAPLPQDFVGTKLPHSHRVRRSLSHTGIVSPDRGAEPPRTPVPPQKGAVTVVRNLEEMVMFRSQHWSQQGPAPDSPVGTIVEEREARMWPILMEVQNCPCSRPLALCPLTQDFCTDASSGWGCFFAEGSSRFCGELCQRSGLAIKTLILKQSARLHVSLSPMGAFPQGWWKEQLHSVGRRLRRRYGLKLLQNETASLQLAGERKCLNLCGSDPNRWVTHGGCRLFFPSGSRCRSELSQTLGAAGTRFLQLPRCLSKIQNLPQSSCEILLQLSSWCLDPTWPISRSVAPG